MINKLNILQLVNTNRKVSGSQNILRKDKLLQTNAT